MPGELYTDKQGNSVVLKELLKGKTPDQEAALKFFQGIPVKQGCFSKKYLSAEEYSQIVRRRGASVSKESALGALGLDEDEVNEIDPVMFEGYRYEHKDIKPYITEEESRIYSSMYQKTWLFFGDDQVYVYCVYFDTTDLSKEEQTLEYFYNDVTSFASQATTLERKVWMLEKKGSCSTHRVSHTRSICSELFKITVPGDSFLCAYTEASGAKEKIAAMKNKLREKKRK